MRASTAVCLTGVTALIVSFVSFAPAVKAARGQSSPSGQTSSQQPAPPGGERKPGPAITFQVPPMPELPNNGLGESDQPQIPGQPWRVRDLNRPRPADVTPGKHFGDAPPARTTIAAAGLPKSARIEIDAVALRRDA